MKGLVRDKQRTMDDSEPAEPPNWDPIFSTKLPQILVNAQSYFRKQTGVHSVFCSDALDRHIRPCVNTHI